MKVGVIGAGTMGQGIAKAFAQVEGYEVALCDIKQTLLISAKVELVPPKTIPRSEGKAKRITDNRHIGF